MIDEFLELEKLKKYWDCIKYLLFEPVTALTLVVKEKETIMEIKEIIREYEGW